MTPNDAITLLLDRAGLSPTSTGYRAQGLLYLNAAMHDLESRPAGGWWWLRKRSTFTTTDGTRLYALATDVLYPTVLRDSTNNRLLHPMTLEQALERDPDLDEEGDARWWYHSGVSSSTGAVQLGLYPIPGTTNDTIGYEYYGCLADLTNANDDTSDFLTTYGIPTLLHPALWQGGAKLYLEENGDTEAALACNAEFERVIKFGLRVNLRQRGNLRLRWGRPRGQASGSVPIYTPEEGSLS